MNESNEAVIAEQSRWRSIEIDFSGQAFNRVYAAIGELIAAGRDFKRLEYTVRGMNALVHKDQVQLVREAVQAAIEAP
jgi:hypothetical protein